MRVVYRASLTTSTSHRSSRAAEILLASTTRSHWDAKVIYSSGRRWKKAMTSTTSNVHPKVQDAIIASHQFRHTCTFQIYISLSYSIGLITIYVFTLLLLEFINNLEKHSNTYNNKIHVEIVVTHNFLFHVKYYVPYVPS